MQKPFMTDPAVQHKCCFDPVLDGRTRLLILGSLPGEKSLTLQQYYANPQNAFWRLMSAVTQTALVPLAYQERLGSLLAHGVGLWDVVARARRHGSLDSAIHDREDNDLLALLARFPQIATIAFNGGTASKLGQRLLGARTAHYRIVELPSSSPAYTRPYDEKLDRWMALRQAF